MPDKQHPCGRLWLNDGSCLRLRPEHRNHVWSDDFVLVRDVYGRKIRMLTLIDEYSRMCLVVHCARHIGVKTAYIEPGSPWENGYCESFNGTLRNELLDGDIFYGVQETQVLVDRWARHYNTRPHSSLGYKPSAPEAIINMPMQNLHSVMHRSMMHILSQQVILNWTQFR